MATGLTDLGNHLTSAALGPFVPKPYYEPNSDSLVYYARDARSYEHRVNEYVTFFLSVDDDSIVGVEIKGVRATLVPALCGLGQVQLLKPMKLKDADGEEVDLALMIRIGLLPGPEGSEGIPDGGAATFGRDVRLRKRELLET